MRISTDTALGRNPILGATAEFDLDGSALMLAMRTILCTKVRMRFVLTSVLCLLALPAFARSPLPRSTSSLCGAAIARVQSSARLPSGLMLAIAQVESGRPDADTGRLRPWPWTIDAEGNGEFFTTKAEAIAAVKRLQARGVRSIDVGCMQINLAYHPHAFSTLEQAFDPSANARYAVRFLNRLFDTSHDWMQVIAAYHSSSPSIGSDYRRRVMALWKNPEMAGWGVGLAVAYRDFLPRQAVYGDFLPVQAIYGAFAGAGGTSLSH